MHALQLSDPQVIGPYRLLGRLGGGGMGQVFLGLSAGRRLVAVKVIRAELAADPEFRARFRREIAAARKVSGLYTAAVVDAETDGSVPWLATVYVAGPSLSQAIMEHGPLPAGSILALAAGLAESLTAIHAAGVVHRDLKPSNVLLAEDGPRVIDFGISRAAEGTSMTRAGLVMGSPGYMSPEQAEGRDVGPSSDIFSLGAVLVFAGTGEGPFGGGSTAALVYRVVHSPANLDRVPDEVRPLVERCLTKDPGDRPTAAGLLAEAGAGRLDAGWLPASLNATLGRYAPPGLPAVAVLAGPPDLPAPGYPPAGGPSENAARWPTTAARGGEAPPAALMQSGDPGGRPPRRKRRRLAWVTAPTALAAAAAVIAAMSLSTHPRAPATALSSHPATSMPPAARTSRSAFPEASSAASPSTPVSTSSSPGPGNPTATYAQAPVQQNCIGSSCNGLNSNAAVGCTSDAVSRSAPQTFLSTSAGEDLAIQLRGSPSCESRWARVWAFNGSGSQWLPPSGLQFTIYSDNADEQLVYAQTATVGTRGWESYPYWVGPMVSGVGLYSKACFPNGVCTSWWPSPPPNS
jgi:eukaryotic-like serine/threonine-protein kinase